MGIGTTLADRKGKEKCELPKVTHSNSNANSNTHSAHSRTNTRKHRRRQRKVPRLPVQKLYETCKEVFAQCGPGIVPSSENIEKLRAVLDEIKPADVDLTPEMPYFRTLINRRVPAITYLHLYECDKFSIGIFCLPPSGVIPLHNHPGMTVFSKLLFGNLHIKSYDWVADVPSGSSASASPSQSNAVHHPEVQLAKLKVNSEFTAPCNPTILYPADGGNMHCLTAKTACAVLDVLGPPYSDPDGRHCTYYSDFPFADFSVDGITMPEEERKDHAWLQEKEKPEDLAVVGALYRGPKIVAT